MIRFLQQFETGAGDYATERHEWADGLSLAELRALARKTSLRACRRTRSHVRKKRAT